MKIKAVMVIVLVVSSFVLSGCVSSQTEALEEQNRLTEQQLQQRDPGKLTEMTSVSNPKNGWMSLFNDGQLPMGRCFGEDLYIRDHAYSGYSTQILEDFHLCA